MLVGMVWFHRGTPSIAHNIQDFPENTEEKFYRLWSHWCVHKGLSRDTWLDAGPGVKRRLEGQWKAKSKHRLDLGVGELRGIEGHWVSEGWRGWVTAGTAVSCQVWVDSQGSLSASRNISIFHLPSPLAGLIRARLTARQRAACPALRCTDVWLYPKRQKT